MSSKALTWKEVIKRRYNTVPEKSETETSVKSEPDIIDKVDEKPVSASKVNEIVNRDEEVNENFNFKPEEVEDDYESYSSDYDGIGVGHTIVCQVTPNYSPC